MKILLFFFVNTVRKAFLFAIALKEADKQQDISGNFKFKKSIPRMLQTIREWEQQISNKRGKIDK